MAQDNLSKEVKNAENEQKTRQIIYFGEEMKHNNKN